MLMHKTGFAVLRNATVTAALCESSFFTNPDEEQRLRQPKYNLREAHGLFVGLAKYAAAGLPRATLVKPARDMRVRGDVRSDDRTQESDAELISPAETNGRVLIFELDDGLRGRRAWGHERTMILAHTIAVSVDGRIVPHVFEDDGERYLLTVRLPDEFRTEEIAVDLQFQNMNKNSVLNPHFKIRLP
jgi:N-acetylmuramoyl-L-alanine amidase